QPQPLLEPKHFLDPPHRHLRSWHLPAPPKRGDGSRHYLALSSEARADQGCRKRRYQVPDWSEIRCRFPPKSPAAFDRNQVPVCSDFCRRGESREEPEQNHPVAQVRTFQTSNQISTLRGRCSPVIRAPIGPYCAGACLSSKAS